MSLVARRREAHNTSASALSSEDVPYVRSAMVNADGRITLKVATDASRTATAIVPVKVWPKTSETPIITYAFLIVAVLLHFALKP